MCAWDIFISKKHVVGSRQLRMEKIDSVQKESAQTNHPRLDNQDRIASILIPFALSRAYPGCEINL